MPSHSQFENDEFVEDSNTSNNPEFSSLIDKQLSRRSVLKGGASLTTLAFFGGIGLAGCRSQNAVVSHQPAQKIPNLPKSLKFSAVPHSTKDTMTVADGYTAQMMLPLGTPLFSGIDDFKDNRENLGESFLYRMGDNHDGMWFFGKNGNRYDPQFSDRGLLAMNHEYTNPELNPLGFYSQKNPDAPPIYQKQRLAQDVRREVHCHGVSVVELKRRASGMGYEMVKDSPFNKRHTSQTVAKLSGVVAGSDFVKTKFDRAGFSTQGINNQCGAGLSPWGTYLTTEENFLNVFARGADKDIIGDKADTALNRYGLKQNGTGGDYLWHTPPTSDAIIDDEFSRWDITASQNSAKDDYRNAFNTFGYIVEIDPFSPNANAVKRTSLGRFAHENCAFAPAVEGQPLVFYMGDDARGEYIYKFVSDAKWSNIDIGGGLLAGDKYMNKGTLYVAVFHENGTGEWRALSYGKNGLDSTNADYPFANQADVLVHARLAGDKVGATKMDRPEWVSVSPVTGEIYVTLTNNSKRKPEDTNAANPRSYNNKGNKHGHIIRFAENDGKHDGTAFVWDIYLFASPYDLTGENLSNLNKNNDLSSPDGLFFDPRGVLWIQTDDGAYTDTTNCMLLAGLPGKVGDGMQISTTAGKTSFVGKPASDDTLKRFFVGPKGCEVTGITMTPDFKTLFVNIQHPEGTWGAVAGGTTPRSATVMITKNDGGVILGESFDN